MLCHMNHTVTVTTLTLSLTHVMSYESVSHCHHTHVVSHSCYVIWISQSLSPHSCCLSLMLCHMNHTVTVTTLTLSLTHVMSYESVSHCHHTHVVSHSCYVIWISQSLLPHSRCLSLMLCHMNQSVTVTTLTLSLTHVMSYESVSHCHHTHVVSHSCYVIWISQSLSPHSRCLSLMLCHMNQSVTVTTLTLSLTHVMSYESVSHCHHTHVVSHSCYVIWISQSLSPHSRCLSLMLCHMNQSVTVTTLTLSLTHVMSYESVSHCHHTHVVSHSCYVIWISQSLSPHSRCLSLMLCHMNQSVTVTTLTLSLTHVVIWIIQSLSPHSRCLSLMLSYESASHCHHTHVVSHSCYVIWISQSLSPHSRCLSLMLCYMNQPVTITTLTLSLTHVMSYESVSHCHHTHVVSHSCYVIWISQSLSPHSRCLSLMLCHMNQSVTVTTLTLSLTHVMSYESVSHCHHTHVISHSCYVIWISQSLSPHSRCLSLMLCHMNQSVTVTTLTLSLTHVMSYESVSHCHHTHVVSHSCYVIWISQSLSPHSRCLSLMLCHMNQSVTVTTLTLSLTHVMSYESVSYCHHTHVVSHSCYVIWISQSLSPHSQCLSLMLWSRSCLMTNFIHKVEHLPVFYLLLTWMVCYQPTHSYTCGIRCTRKCSCLISQITTLRYWLDLFGAKSSHIYSVNRNEQTFAVAKQEAVRLVALCFVASSDWVVLELHWGCHCCGVSFLTMFSIGTQIQCKGVKNQGRGVSWVPKWWCDRTIESKCKNPVAKFEGLIPVNKESA